MRKRWIKKVCAGAALAISLPMASLVIVPTRAAWAQKPIPPAPQYYVLDEPHLLSERSLRALQALLVEHDRATGEQFVIAVFDSLGGEDLNDFTNRVFQSWAIGKRGEDNGILLAVFYKDHKARIEVGYGLEPLLTDAKSSRILRDTLVPEMRAGRPDQAISLSAMQVLTTINSPLIQSGRAEQILRSGDFGHRNRTYAQPSSNGWLVWLFLGIILMIIVSNIMSSADAHFTRQGWYRPRPWRRRWRDSGRGGWGGGFGGGGLGGWRGGGGGWGGGGDGGFSGGGGRSGGGGASAGW